MLKINLCFKNVYPPFSKIHELNPQGGLFRIFQYQTQGLAPSEESKNDIYKDIHQLLQVLFCRQILTVDSRDIIYGYIKTEGDGIETK